MTSSADRDVPSVSPSFTITKRREFLKRGLLAVGAAVAGATVSKTFAAVSPSQHNHAAGPSSTTPALTPDGKLIQVESNSMTHFHTGRAVSDPAVRIGM